MGYSKVTISSGHSTKVVRGAVGNGYIENAEAVKVVNRVAEILKSLGVSTTVYHDSHTTQTTNVNSIVAYHNSTNRQLDISVHFNAGSPSATGTEVLYVSNDMKTLSAKLSAKIAKTLGIKDRGAKLRTDLGFLNRTTKPALLIETCFISNDSDMNSYIKNFEAMCKVIAEVISDKTVSTTTNAVTYETKVSSTHIGVATTLAQVNLYSKANTNSYLKKITKGSWKVYSISNNMYCLGGNQWILSAEKSNGLITYKQRVLKIKNVAVNYYSNPNTNSFAGRLPANMSYVVYGFSADKKFVDVGNNHWVKYNTQYMELT